VPSFCILPFAGNVAFMLKVGSGAIVATAAVVKLGSMYVARWYKSPPTLSTDCAPPVNAPDAPNVPLVAPVPLLPVPLAAPLPEPPADTAPLPLPLADTPVVDTPLATFVPLPVPMAPVEEPVVDTPLVTPLPPVVPAPLPAPVAAADPLFEDVPDELFALELPQPAATRSEPASETRRAPRMKR
jgi:hypothetical protein